MSESYTDLHASVMDIVASPQLSPIPIIPTYVDTSLASPTACDSIVSSYSFLTQPIRSTRVKKTPAWMTDFITQLSSSQAPIVDQVNTSLDGAVSTIPVSPSCRTLLSSIENTHDLVTFPKATKDIYWSKAMDAELKALEDNGI